MGEAQQVGIIGAGTMGAGIAQVAAAYGWTVWLLDVSTDVAETACGDVRARFDRLVAKERMTAEERDAASARLHVVRRPAEFAECELVIEAIIERLDIKANALIEVLGVVDEEAMIATNTSSLSITELAESIDAPTRTVGMHFFNPAPLMQLVEVIAGRSTDRVVVDRVADIATSWGKRVARSADVPGFIVNHVARPYYLEAFRVLDDRLAGVEEIDDVMRRIGGFRMGPFELTDLIGQDVNATTTRSVWTQLNEPPLLTPSPLQESLVEQGHLGKKSGRGAYDYSGDEPVPAIDITPTPVTMGAELERAVEEFVANAEVDAGNLHDSYVFGRIVCAIFVQAIFAEHRGVASSDDIDTALRFGVNYPRGPFEWMNAIGVDRVDALRVELNRSASDHRFRLP